MNKEVRDFLKKMRKAGKSDGEIKQLLLDADWTEEDVAKINFIEESVIPSELNSEENEDLQSVPREKYISKKFLFVALIILLISGVWITNYRLTQNKELVIPSFDMLAQSKDEKVVRPYSSKVSISEGLLQINEEESLIFPSGAILRLKNNNLYFLYNADVSWQEALSFDSKLIVYVNGYLHKFENVICDEENRWFGDYSSLVVTQCRIQYSGIASIRPILSQYDGKSVDFTSVKSRRVSRFSTLQEDPWIAVSVPYFQIVESMDSSVMNSVSPREDVVNVYTNYGRADFRFEADELKNEKSKTIVKGPLSISLIPQELICEADNISEESCYVLEYEDKRYINYNMVDFRLIINEKDSLTDYPLLIDIER